MGFTRRELLTNGVIGGAVLGGLPGGERAADAAEEKEINQTLKALVSEIQQPEHSFLPGDAAYVNRLREQMLAALYRANASAFDGNNMNRLRAGGTLPQAARTAQSATRMAQVRIIVLLLSLQEADDFE